MWSRSNAKGNLLEKTCAIPPALTQALRREHKKKKSAEQTSKLSNINGVRLRLHEFIHHYLYNLPCAHIHSVTQSVVDYYYAQINIVLATCHRYLLCFRTNAKKSL